MGKWRQMEPKEVEDMGNGYNGKHDNKGTQVVKAPNGAGSGTTKGNVVHRGTDLRTGKQK